MFQFKPAFEKSDHDTVVAITDEGVVTFNQYTKSTTLHPFAKLRSISIRRESILERILFCVLLLMLGLLCWCLTYFLVSFGSYILLILPIAGIVMTVGSIIYFFAPLNIFFYAVTKFGKRYRTIIEPDVWLQRLRPEVEKWFHAVATKHGDAAKFSFDA